MIDISTLSFSQHRVRTEEAFLSLIILLRFCIPTPYKSIFFEKISKAEIVEKFIRKIILFNSLQFAASFPPKVNLKF